MIDIRKIYIRWVFPALPVIQIIATLYSSFFNYHPDKFGYEVGYSIITSLFYLTTFSMVSKYKYCFIPFYCSLGLLLMTIVDWQKEYTSYDKYSIIYDFTITIIVTLLIAMAWTVNRRKIALKQ